MAKKPNPKKTPVDGNEVTSLVDAPQVERDDAQDRAGMCAKEISAILDKHRCRIMPRIDMANIEPVGLAGNKIQIESTFWIAPLA